MSIDLPPQSLPPNLVNPTIQTSAGSITSQQINTTLQNPTYTFNVTPPKLDPSRSDALLTNMIGDPASKVDPNTLVNRPMLINPNAASLQDSLSAALNDVKNQLATLNDAQNRVNTLQAQINGLTNQMNSTWNPITRIILSAQIISLQQQLAVASKQKVDAQGRVNALQEAANKITQSLQQQTQSVTQTGGGGKPGAGNTLSMEQLQQLAKDPASIPDVVAKLQQAGLTLDSPAGVQLQIVVLELQMQQLAKSNQLSATQVDALKTYMAVMDNALGQISQGTASAADLANINQVIKLLSSELAQLSGGKAVPQNNANNFQNTTVTTVTNAINTVAKPVTNPVTNFVNSVKSFFGF